MNEAIEGFVNSMTQNQKNSGELLDKVLVAAQPGAVFSIPIQLEKQTLITASEVIAGGALGFGGGIGYAPSGEGGNEAQSESQGGGVGGGSGGIGGSTGRPVAVIVASQEGVHVEPIMDVTKISLAFFTALGAILISLFKMRKAVLTKK